MVMVVNLVQLPNSPSRKPLAATLDTTTEI